MRLISIVAGIAVGALAAFLILGVLGAAGAPLHVVFILLAIGAGVAAGVVAARRVERREDRLEAARRERITSV